MIDKILVIGPGSLTGSRFIELLDKQSFSSNKKIEVWGAGGNLDAGFKNVADFKTLDITNRQNVLDVISSFPGEYIINFAGATLVSEIEKSRPKNPFDQSVLETNPAYRVNTLGTRNILEVCKDVNKFPIFLSTGYVFDGKNGPYSENDKLADNPDDVSWYSWTKILAENAIKNSQIESLIIRISYPYRSEYEEKKDFARNFLKIYDEVKSGARESFPPIFADQYLTPTFIDDLAPGISLLIEKGGTGVFNIASPEITTPYEFCLELLRVARGVEGPEKLVSRGSVYEYEKSHPEMAKYPIKGGEKVGKIESLGFKPTSWKEGIQKAFVNTKEDI